MRSEAPDVAAARDWFLTDIRNVVLVGETGSAYRRQCCRQLLLVESEQRQICTEGRQVLQLEAEHLQIPAGIHGYPVVGEDQLPALHLGQAAKDDHRDLLKSQLPRRRQTPMTGDDVPILADENGIGEAEGADAPGN